VLLAHCPYLPLRVLLRLLLARLPPRLRLLLPQLLLRQHTQLPLPWRQLWRPWHNRWQWMSPLLESGVSGHRPDHATATVPRSDEVREEERMLETFGLLTVQMDGRVRLPVLLVRTEVARQLHILPDALGATRLSEASFLLNFDDQHRNSARNKVLCVGLIGSALVTAGWGQ
jgi:hypothetical protein